MFIIPVCVVNLYDTYIDAYEHKTGKLVDTQMSKFFLTKHNSSTAKHFLSGSL